MARRFRICSKMKMTSNTVYTYIKFTTNDAKRDSARLLSEALTLFWAKTDLEPEEIQRTCEGKPYFPSGRSYLSVTHTGNLFAVVFASRPIGIDGEKAEEKRSRIAEKKFSPQERLLPFSYVWSAKEAVSKLVGTGLADLMQVSVTKGRAIFGGKGYTLREEILGDYRLVTATEEGWDYGAEALSEK